MPLLARVATLATDTAIKKKTLGLGTTLIISDEEMDDIKKIVPSLEQYGLLIKLVSETITYEARKK